MELAPEEWRKLRSEFIEAAAKYENEGYRTFIERTARSEEHHSTDRYERVAEIKWPYRPWRTCWILAPSSGTNEEPFAVMKTLFTKAWLRLPIVVAGRIVDTAVWQLSPRDDVGLSWARSHYELWCWLLWFDWLWRCGEVETEEPEFPPAGMDLQPFSSSVGLIGRWGLDGGDGTFPEWLSPKLPLDADLQAPVFGNDDDTGRTWHEIQAKLERLRLKGESFTSQEELAKKIGCTTFLIEDALKRGSAELQEWATKQHETSRPNASPVGAAVALEISSQSREDESGGSRESNNVFKREGNTWTIRFNGGKTHRGLKDAKAVPDIHFLLSQEREVGIEDLPGNRGFKEMTRGVSVATKDDFMDLVKQISQLKRELVKEDDLLVKEEIETQIKALEEQQNQNFDKWGNPRQLSGDRKRVIESTQTRINRWYKDNQDELPHLIQYLKDRLSISRQCSYRRDDSILWDLGNK